MKYFYGIYVKNTSELLYLVKTLQIGIFFSCKNTDIVYSV